MSKFIRIFKRIELLFFELNPTRKRLIKFNFLFYKIFHEAMPEGFIKARLSFDEPSASADTEGEGFQFMNSDKIFSVKLSKPTVKKYDEIWSNLKNHL